MSQQKIWENNHDEDKTDTSTMVKKNKKPHKTFGFVPQKKELQHILREGGGDNL